MIAFCSSSYQPEYFFKFLCICFSSFLKRKYLSILELFSQINFQRQIDIPTPKGDKIANKQIITIASIFLSFQNFISINSFGIHHNNHKNMEYLVQSILSFLVGVVPQNVQILFDIFPFVFVVLNTQLPF